MEQEEREFEEARRKLQEELAKSRAECLGKIEREAAIRKKQEEEARQKAQEEEAAQRQEKKQQRLALLELASNYTKQSSAGSSPSRDNNNNNNYGSVGGGVEAVNRMLEEEDDDYYNRNQQLQQNGDRSPEEKLRVLQVDHEKKQKRLRQNQRVNNALDVLDEDDSDSSEDFLEEEDGEYNNYDEHGYDDEEDVPRDGVQQPRRRPQPSPYEAERMQLFQMLDETGNTADLTTTGSHNNFGFGNFGVNLPNNAGVTSYLNEHQGAAGVGVVGGQAAGDNNHNWYYDGYFDVEDDDEELAEDGRGIADPREMDDSHLVNTAKSIHERVQGLVGDPGGCWFKI